MSCLPAASRSEQSHCQSCVWSPSVRTHRVKTTPKPQTEPKGKELSNEIGCLPARPGRETVSKAQSSQSHFKAVPLLLCQSSWRKVEDQESVWRWCIPGIPPLGRLRPEDFKFQAERDSVTNKTTKKRLPRRQARRCVTEITMYPQLVSNSHSLSYLSFCRARILGVTH